MTTGESFFVHAQRLSEVAQHAPAQASQASSPQNAYDASERLTTVAASIALLCPMALQRRPEPIKLIGCKMQAQRQTLRIHIARAQRLRCAMHPCTKIICSSCCSSQLWCLVPRHLTARHDVFFANPEAWLGSCLHLMIFGRPSKQPTNTVPNLPSTLTSASEADINRVSKRT